jgi:hypothetical protein
MISHESILDPFLRLAPARFTSVKVDMDLSQVALTSGKEPDYVPDRLAEVVDTDPINQLLVSIYLERAGDYQPLFLVENPVMLPKLIPT